MDCNRNSISYIVILAFAACVLMFRRDLTPSSATFIAEVQYGTVCFVLSDNPREMIPSMNYLNWHKRYADFLPSKYDLKALMVHDAEEWDECWNGLTMYQIGNPSYGRSYNVDKVSFQNIALPSLDEIGHRGPWGRMVPIAEENGGIKCTMSDADKRLYCALASESKLLVQLGEFDNIRFKLEEKDGFNPLVLSVLHDPADHFAKQRKYMETAITDSAYYQPELVDDASK